MAVHLRIFDELHQHLGIRFGLEGIALLHESGFEDRVVLNDAVMDDREAFGLRVMRMRVDGIRLAVGSPTRMRDTYCTIGILVRAEGFEFCHFAFRFIDVQLSCLVDECHTG